MARQCVKFRLEFNDGSVAAFEGEYADMVFRTYEAALDRAELPNYIMERIWKRKQDGPAKTDGAVEREG